VAIPENETRLNEAALASLLASGAGWTRDGAALTKTFTFKGFKGAVAFVNRVAEAAVTRPFGSSSRPTSRMA